MRMEYYLEKGLKKTSTPMNVELLQPKGKSIRFQVLDAMTLDTRPEC